MRIAYFDLSSGVSGDMILGALVDAGLSFSVLEKLVQDLPIPGCRVTFKKLKKAGIAATRVDVIVPSSQQKRPVQILALLDSLDLPSPVREKSKQIFLYLAEAEMKIHQEDLESLHLHELGSPDTVVDIVGSVVGMDTMGIDKVYASGVNVGGGTINTSHGNLPVPAPATAELLEGAPIYSTGINAELTTPTGAAILKGLSVVYGPVPSLKLEKVGYGAGEKDLTFPNALRVLIGQRQICPEEDYIAVLETNIDDMDPQFYEYVVDLLFKRGAVDVFLTPTYMKKNRPGVMLTVICEEERKEDMLGIIFEQTTTLGVRISGCRRKKLKREVRTFQTSLGKVRVKLGMLGEKMVSAKPEYQDCKEIADKIDLPLREVYHRIKKEIPFDF